MSLWVSLGFIRYPLLLSAVAVLSLGLLATTRLLGSDPRADLRTKAWIDAVFFWGGFAFIAGILGTLIGMIIASQSIEAAGSVSTSLVWGGIKVALLSSAVGALILSLSALAWFGLQLRWRLLVAARTEASA